MYCLLICGYFFFFRQLEAKLQQSSTELESTKMVLRQKQADAQKNQEELKGLKDNLLELEKRLEDQVLEVVSSQRKVEDFQATIRQQEGELARLREVLRRTEKELDERVAHLEQRYLFSEEERSLCIKISLHPIIMVQSKSVCTVLVSRQDSKGGPEESGRVKSGVGLAKRDQTI